MSIKRVTKINMYIEVHEDELGFRRCIGNVRKDGNPCGGSSFSLSGNDLGVIGHVVAQELSDALLIDGLKDK